MTNQDQSSNVKKSKKYDLQERTALMGEAIVDFCGSIRDTPINRPLINQLTRSGTSVGANYMEADSASTRKDFLHKIGLCKKEAKETMHWLRMMVRANPSQREVILDLEKESHELALIFSSIFNKTRQKSK